MSEKVPRIHPLPYTLLLLGLLMASCDTIPTVRINPKYIEPSNIPEQPVQYDSFIHLQSKLESDLGTNYIEGKSMKNSDKTAIQVYTINFTIDLSGKTNPDEVEQKIDAYLSQLPALIEIDGKTYQLSASNEDTLFNAIKHLDKHTIYIGRIVYTIQSKITQ
jgi:hypothetical protein